MPFQSEAQRRAMYAAAEGKSTLGIPPSVGKKFIEHKDDTVHRGDAAGILHHDGKAESYSLKGPLQLAIALVFGRFLEGTLSMVNRLLTLLHAKFGKRLAVTLFQLHLWVASTVMALASMHLSHRMRHMNPILMMSQKMPVGLM